MTATQHAAAARRTSNRDRAEARTERTRRFDDSLRDARRAAGRNAPTPPADADTPVAHGTPTPRRTGADRDARLRDRREGFRHPERTEDLHAAGAAAPPPPLAAQQPSPITVPELRALIRTLPVSVDAHRVREGAPLALELGQALSVELRRRPDGLELLLRPDASLVRAAAAELPAVVRALRARGLTVARAEVRARADGGSPARDSAR
jgi:hypothetical protein